MPDIVSHFVDCHIFRRRAGREEWLMLKRAPNIRLGGTWQMVSGCIEPGEKAYAAALRELKEETGLHPLHFYQASYVNRFYLAATDQIMLTPVFAAEVHPEAEVLLSDEHTDFEWVGHDEAARRFPWPGQRRSLQVIREQFLEGSPRSESCLDALVG
ncbi:MAG: dihydroneopterin triphosphate diphosphatase [Thermoplasmata archaeon]|nr:dihydroneopterin triphosphate diphosphatase [Thermoplasmata archaeon]